MLENSKLPINLWAAADNTAVHLLNRRTCKPEESRTPYEKFTEKELKLDHIRKFGATAYALIPKSFRKKFASKSGKLFRVGYDGNGPNYRFYDIETKEVQVDRDVVFNGEKCNGDHDYTFFEITSAFEDKPGPNMNSEMNRILRSTQ
ncbi:hypothetical protein JTB14_001917 [Gonioctena quinquepunctata]|nr:hypothetical protein JTB14_001917 [Gonioctena quinquepunctata]